MNCKTLYLIVIIGSVAGFETDQADCSAFTKLIFELNEIHQFKNIFTFISIHHDRLTEESHNCDILLALENKIPLVIITTNLTIAEKFHKNSLAIILIQNLTDSDLLITLDISLRRIHATKLLFIVESDPNQLPDDLNILFRWCWSKKFLNVIVHIITNQLLFTYNPYPVFRIENITTQPKQLFYPNRIHDLQGYDMRVIFKIDPPRSFHYTNSKGEQISSGPLWQLFVEFLKFLNATTSDKFTMEYYNSHNELAFIQNATVDFACAMCVMIPLNLLRVSITRLPAEPGLFVLVPTSKEITKSSYFLIPFDQYIWISLICLLAYLTLMDGISYYIYMGRLDFGRSFCKSLRGLLYLGFWQSEERESRRVFVFTQIWALSFIMTNIYLAHLASYLTHGVLEDDIDSVDDMIRVQLKVLVPKRQVATVKALHIHNFDKIMLPVSSAMFYDKRNHLNTSYGYVSQMNPGKLILKQQSNSEYPLLRFAKNQLAPLQFGIPLNLDSPFVEILDRFVSWIVESGLYSLKWSEDHFYHLHQAGELKFLDGRQEEDVIYALGIEHLSMAFYVLGGGVCISLITFIVEMICMIVNKRS